ncbi:MAG: hypothetical protein KDA91_08685 [Planctomycetaceae bacterium]|nr:hypothetical protein [Planctomycetaceae bacterium]
MNSIAKLFRVSCVLNCILLTGCHSWQKSHLAAVHYFEAGQLADSREQLTRSLESRGAEKELLTLDHAIVALADGDAQECESALREVRLKLDYLTQKDAGEQVTAFLSDENAIAWSGRDYERLMVDNILLLSSLVSNGTDSFAYATQVTKRCNDELKTLVAASQKAAGNQSTPGDESSVVRVASHETLHGTGGVDSLTSSASLQPLAMAAYLTTAVMSESILRQDLAETARNQVGVWNKEFADRDAVADSGGFGMQCPAGWGAVHVIAMVGQAPEWKSESAEPTSTALLLADRILSATGKHSLPPTIAPVQIGHPVVSADTPPAGFLTGNVQTAGHHLPSQGIPLTFLTLVDLNQAAVDSYRTHRDQEIARAIARRIVKKGAVYAVKESQDVTRNSLVDLAVNIGGVIWEAMERPDLRSWRLLPARIEVARTQLPEGDSEVCIRTAGQRDPLRIPVNIQNGRNTYVVLFVPNRSVSGKVLLGGPEYRAM